MYDALTFLDVVKQCVGRCGAEVFGTVLGDVADESFVQELFDEVVDGGAVESGRFLDLARGCAAESKEGEIDCRFTVAEADVVERFLNVHCCRFSDNSYLTVSVTYCIVVICMNAECTDGDAVDAMIGWLSVSNNYDLSNAKITILTAALDAPFRVNHELWSTQHASSPKTRGDALTDVIAQLYYERGNCLNNLERYEDAIPDFSKSIDLTDDRGTLTKLLHSRGEVFHTLGRFDDAGADYSRLIQIDSNDAVAWNNRGVFFDKDGLFDDAVAHYSRAIELDTNYAEAWSNRGISFLRVGRFGDAVFDFTRALELEPNAKRFFD